MIVQIHKTVIERYDIKGLQTQDTDRVLATIQALELEPFKSDIEINLVDILE